MKKKATVASVLTTFERALAMLSFRFASLPYNTSVITIIAYIIIMRRDTVLNIIMPSSGREVKAALNS